MIIEIKAKVDGTRRFTRMKSAAELRRVSMAKTWKSCSKIGASSLCSDAFRTPSWNARKTNVST